MSTTFMQELAARANHSNTTTARFGGTRAQAEHLEWVNAQVIAKVAASSEGMAAIIDATIGAYMAVNDITFDKYGTDSAEKFGDAKPYHDFVAKLAALETSITKASSASARIMSDCLAAHPPQGCGEYHPTAHLLAALTFGAQTGHGSRANSREQGRARALVDSIERYLVLEGEAEAIANANILDVLQEHFGIDFTVHVITETNRLGREEVIGFTHLEEPAFDFTTAFNAREVIKVAAMSEMYSNPNGGGTDVNGVQCGEFPEREEAPLPDTFEMMQRHVAGSF